MSDAKRALRDELVQTLADDLETLERAHRATIEGATHADAKPENDKDTRALEQQYLARGQAMRVEELRASLAEVRAMPLRDFAEDAPAALGALVTIEEDGEESTLFVAPQGGGSRLAGGDVQVVTPRSPLGRALLGRRAGEDFEVKLAGKSRAITVVRVA
jgi:transcription elongation GreA/GreB family factor